MPNERRQELLAHWGIQENLLQQYRVIGITHQSIIAAILLIIISIIENKFTEYDGILNISRNIDQSRQFMFIPIIALYAILLIIGSIGTYRFIIITNDRARNITLLQNMLVMEENGKLESTLKLFEMENAPIYGMIHYFQSNNDLDFEYGIKTTTSDNAKEFFLYTLSMTNNKNRHHVTREYMKKTIFQLFYILWGILSLYFIGLISYVIK